MLASLINLMGYKEVITVFSYPVTAGANLLVSYATHWEWARLLISFAAQEARKELLLHKRGVSLQQDREELKIQEQLFR